MGHFIRNRDQTVWARVAAILLVLALLVTSLSVAPSVTGTVVPDAQTPESESDDDEDAGSESELAEELPPPDLPTTNEQGYTFNLQSSINVDLDTVEQEAAIYELERQEMSQEDAQQLADRLRIGAEVEDQGEGGFTASGNGQLFISPDVIQYLSLEEIRGGDLPSDEVAIAFAREWLRLTGLTPPDLGEAMIASRTEDSQRVVVMFVPVEPEDLLAAFPSITVTLGPTGTILEAAIRWAEIRRADLYRLRPADDAWQQVQSGLSYIEADILEAEIEPGSEIQGTVTYNDVKIAYTTAGPPGGRQYLEPVFVFQGRVRLEGGDDTYSIKAYVAALANSGAPVGSIGPVANG